MIPPLIISCALLFLSVLGLHSHAVTAFQPAEVTSKPCHAVSTWGGKRASVSAIPHATRAISEDTVSSSGSAVSQPSTKQRQEERAGLKFKSSLEYLTRSVPLPPPTKDLEDFFKTGAYLKLPLGSNRKAKISRVQLATPDQLEKWTNEAKRSGAVVPVPGDKVMEFNVVTPFLVFEIHYKGIIGFKVLLPSEYQYRRKDPEFQFLLLEQEFYADGPPPLVWMFNKLTGLDQQKDTNASREIPTKEEGEKGAVQSSQYEQLNHGFYRVKSVVSDDGSRLAFAMRMDTEICVNFPKPLLQILPVDKTVIEKQGSQSLRKSMERDIPSGVDAFRQSYLDWLASE